jgi:hypothetical protein
MVSERHLDAKQRPGKLAINRLEDGVGTASRAPFKFLSALEHVADQQGLPPASLATLARNSWRFVHSVAMLDLDSYQFLEEELFLPREVGSQGAVRSWRFADYADTKWARLITFDSEKLTLKLDVSPKKLGEISLSDDEVKKQRSMPSTGADRLRCPITHLPKELTERYVGFLVDVLQAANVWPADNAVA